MKTPYTTPIQSITHNCCYVPDGGNVIFIARSQNSSVSAIALASALTMHGIDWICASYPGTCEQLDLALGAENVIKLPVWSINPQSRYLGVPIQHAREEGAVLLIDAKVTPSFEFGQLPDAMNLLRGDTLSIILSLAGMDDAIPNMESIWNCHPDRSVVHVLGSDPGNHTGENFGDLRDLVPTWYSGEITKEMLQVINRSGPYVTLPATPDLSGMFYKIPEDSSIRQDHHTKAVVEMLASAREDALKSIFDAFVCEMF